MLAAQRREVGRPHGLTDLLSEVHYTVMVGEEKGLTLPIDAELKSGCQGFRETS